MIRDCNSWFNQSSWERYFTHYSITWLAGAFAGKMGNKKLNILTHWKTHQNLFLPSSSFLYMPETTTSIDQRQRFSYQTPLILKNHIDINLTQTNTLSHSLIHSKNLIKHRNKLEIFFPYFILFWPKNLSV